MRIPCIPWDLRDSRIAIAAGAGRGRGPMSPGAGPAGLPHLIDWGGGWGVNQAYSSLSTTHGHITDCKLDSVVLIDFGIGANAGLNLTTWFAHGQNITF